jgi:hypothetical protein
LPIALEVVKRIDVPSERDINGRSAAEWLVTCQELSAPRAELESWIRDQRAKLSRHDPVAPALDYMLTRWSAFVALEIEPEDRCLTVHDMND